MDQPPSVPLSWGMFFTLLLASTAATRPSSSSAGYHDVPSFSLSDLLGRRRSSDLADALGSTGLIAVTVPVGGGGGGGGGGLRTSRSDALGGLCRCVSFLPSRAALLESVDGADGVALGGGSARTTVATATAGVTPLPLPAGGIDAACGGEGGAYLSSAMEDLRDHAAEASRAFVVAVDGLLREAYGGKNDEASPGGEDGPLMRSVRDDGSERIYRSLSEVVRGARHLEHFHVYSKDGGSERQGEDEESIALDLHTDAGLFLSFVPALPCDGNDDSFDGSFLVSVPTGGGELAGSRELRMARFPPNSVAIMLGIGAEQWLKLPQDSYGSAVVPLRAARHAVRMRSGQRRAWYGMMHLVPEHAVVQESPLRTFTDMRKFMAYSSKMANKRRFSDNFDEDMAGVMAVSVGCGVVPSPPTFAQADTLSSPRHQRSRRRLQMVDDASACNNQTNFYCWMSCLEIPDAKHAKGRINEGEALYCLDPAKLAASGNRVSIAVEECELAGVPGAAMNEACMGSWQPKAPGVPYQEVNVDGGGNGGNMSGEQPFCYGATSMYMQGFQWLGTTCVVYLFPSWVLSSATKLAVACVGTLAFGVALEGVIHCRRSVLGIVPQGWGRLAASTALYGLQLAMGYLVMLLVMTYSGPLFMSVIFGLMFGHASFNYKTLVQSSPENGTVACPVPEGCTPCCQNDLGPVAATQAGVDVDHTWMEETASDSIGPLGLATPTEEKPVADAVPESSYCKRQAPNEAAPEKCCSGATDTFLDEGVYGSHL